MWEIHGPSFVKHMGQFQRYENCLTSGFVCLPSQIVFEEFGLQSFYAAPAPVFSMRRAASLFPNVAANHVSTGVRGGGDTAQSCEHSDAATIGLN